jgi:hypothetical protein
MILLRSSEKFDASKTAERDVHSLFANSERKPPEGTGPKKSHFFGEILMTKVVYRGIEYDTQKRLEYQQQMMQQPQQYNETYRGVKFTKEGHK